jgi:hypothetical protein
MMRVVTARVSAILAVFVVGVALVHSAGCTGLLSPKEPDTPEAFCGLLNTGTGKYFYCGSSQGNLQGNLPNGWRGMCFVPKRSFTGLVGYSGYASNGGRLPVAPTQAEANVDCGATTTSYNLCSGITRCTRE